MFPSAAETQDALDREKAIDVLTLCESNTKERCQLRVHSLPLPHCHHATTGCRDGDSAGVSQQLRRRPELANAWCPKREMPMLVLAASNGHTEVVAALLLCKADINKASARGHTPVSQAAGNGHETALSLLLDSRADASIGNLGGATPLMAAIEHRRSNSIEQLLGHPYAPNINQADHGGTSRRK